MFRYFISCLTSILFCIQVLAQELPCGTVTPRNSAVLEKSIKNLFNPNSISKCLNKTFSIKYILVTNKERDPIVTMDSLLRSVEVLNKAFAPICVNFQICDFDTVYNFNYEEWDWETLDPEFGTLYTKESVINIVVTNSIIGPTGGAAAGYASLGNSLPPAPRFDMIPLTRPSVTNKAIVHEIGHFFGLYHTFDSDLGLELANGSNCTTSGDFLCDTPADIDPTGITPAPFAGQCNWVSPVMDSNGDLYAPLLGNYMSYHPSSCKNFFTIQQYNRMIFCIENFRFYLY